MRVLVRVPKTVAMVYSMAVNPSSPLQELAHPACVAGQRKGSLAEEKAPTHSGKQTSGRMYQARTQDALEHKLLMTCIEDNINMNCGGLSPC